MTVYFIGAGSGDPELLTIKAQKILSKINCCIYAGSFITKDFLKFYVKKDAKLINSSKMHLDDIIMHIKDFHEKGEDVARLHSGDLSIYSAMNEQIGKLKYHKIDYNIIPGVPSFCAASAAIGQELTIACASQSVILTRVGKNASPVPFSEDLTILGQSRATLVLHLSIKYAEDIYRKLEPLYGAHCPVIIAYRVGFSDEKIFHLTLSSLPNLVIQENLKKTALIFIGENLKPYKNYKDLKSKLYQKNVE